MSGFGTNRQVLVGEAYRDSSRLEARQAIYAFQQPRLDIAGRVVETLADTRGIVIDVGCGNGIYTKRLRRDRPELRIFGFDLSTGMGPDAAADAQQLPLADRSTGAVLAAHMLYHVPDIPRAVAEFARVLLPGGMLIVVTPARDDRHEIGELWSAVTGRPFPDPSQRFVVEDATGVLQKNFANVELREFRTTVVLPESQLVVGYIHSARAGLQRLLPDQDWDDVLTRLRVQADSQIAETGAFHITAHVGLFVCRGPQID